MYQTTGLPLPSAIPKNWPVVVMDIQDCFFSIPLAPQDKARFAFTLPSENLQEPAARYQWTVLPQGMKNSPTICQAAVAKVLQPVRAQFPRALIIHYMDDLLIAAETQQETDQAEQAVINCLNEAGLYVQKAKTQRGESVDYLGTTILPRAVVPQPIKLNKEIRTLHDVQQLVGALQWLRGLIGIPKEWMEPLFELLKGHKPWEPRQMTPNALEALRKIEDLMAKGGVTRYDPARPINLYVAVTRTGAIGVLGQGTPERPEVVWWIVSNQISTAYVTIVTALAQMIQKGRTATVRHFAKEPESIYLPVKRSQWDSVVQKQDSIAIALEGFPGTIRLSPVLEMYTHLTVLRPHLKARVLQRPAPGRTVFTDASSVTRAAVVVWQDQKAQWHRVKISEPDSSVQHLEARAVAQALQMWPEEHLNVVTDSMFVFKLLHNMSLPGWAGSPIALMLEEALQQRRATASVIHVRSHEAIQGVYQEGNNKADQAAKGVWTVAEARQVHDLLHVGAKALAKSCNIPLTTAREVVAACPYCQKTPLWGAGINPRGLKGNQIWQTDFTMCQRLRPRPWLAVTVDTHSGIIVATQHKRVTARAAQLHWHTAMAWLGAPETIKTDNGTCFTAQSTREWAVRWGIKLVHGIAYNSTGQAIVERANRTLKQRIEILGEGEGYTQRIPAHKQSEIIMRALFGLNQFIRGEENKTPAEKHWVVRAMHEGPDVKVRIPEKGEWEEGWQLVTQGRGYAAVRQGEMVRWVPMKWVRPDLRARTRQEAESQVN
ncbi:dual specificity protein phosphatase CDC14A isoform X1 [Dromaius novaehollandiae]|uniref:dual specificity protein phosphatase CDC14A isoform X1 n=1 Tax=Dromaius novaehollandiae TaxID=8790 RepID=UPI00311E64B6